MNITPGPETPEASVSGAFGHSWETLKKHIPELLLVMFLYMLLSLPVGLGRFIFPGPHFSDLTTGFFNLVWGLAVMMPVSYGCKWLWLKAVRGEPFQVTDMFFAYQQFGNILLANILVTLIIGAGIIMLIVPGIIFACKLAFVPYLVMDRKMDAVEAIKKSWNMTKGYAGTIFWMGIVSFFVAIGGLICFVVGLLPASIWISLAFAAIYFAVEVKEQQNQKNEAA